MQYIEGLINIATFSLLVRGLSLVAVWYTSSCITVVSIILLINMNNTLVCPLLYIGKC